MRKIGYSLSTKPAFAPMTAYYQEQRVSRGASVPAPVEGWDAVSPIAAMSPKRAVKLLNWFPQPDWVELRKGYIRWARTYTSEPVETLMAYQGTTSQELFGASAGTIFKVTSGGTGVATLSGMTNSRFQFVNFTTTGGSFLYIVNGADTPYYYDGVAWTAAVITGTGVDPTEIVGVNAHKSRLWFIFNNSTKVAYLPLDSIQGTATTFELGGLMTMGGYIMAAGTWSIDAGTGPQDYLVFVTSRGQVLVYEGNDPDSDFAIVQVFNMGQPLGRRCLTKVGSDLALICRDGVVPISRAMVFERAAVVKVTLTERIQRVMSQSAADYGDNFGWQLISYPVGNRCILNVPVVENETQVQYVMNTLHGAWCEYDDHNGSCWELYQDRIFFGGNNGNVYEADKTGTDYGQVMRADMKTAFNYYAARGQSKRWMMVRPLLTTDQQIEPGLAFNVDFKEDAPISVPSSIANQSAKWDEALWDDSVWPSVSRVEANWTSVTGIGYCASIRMVVDVEAPSIGEVALWGSGRWGVNRWGAQLNGAEVELKVNGFDLIMENGALI
jgi:hypothetical protein